MPPQHGGLLRQVRCQQKGMVPSVRLGGGAPRDGGIGVRAKELPPPTLPAGEAAALADEAALLLHAELP